MILYKLFSVGIGGVIGAWLRYFLSLTFNQVFPTIPLGTLICNVIGGFLMGLFMELTKHHFLVSENIRLAFVTGFLGCFTTFSTFSAETLNLYSNQEYFWTVVIILGHVMGSLIATFSGIVLIKFFLS